MGRNAGSNKFAKIGMAVGSLMAVTTCMFALFGDTTASSLIGQSNVMTESDLSHGVGRSLMSLNQSSQ
jgi:hypothetical protein